MDIMGCRHVLIEKMKISGGGVRRCLYFRPMQGRFSVQNWASPAQDDAVKFGSDWSRGKKVDS